MTKTSKQILFFGTEEFSAVSLQRLINDGHEIAAVVTKPDSKKGRGKKLTSSPTKQIAIKHSIPVWQPENVADIVENIENIPNRLGVLVSYGKIIPKKVLDLFEPEGIINLHPSLLPKYRGPSPIESALLHGDKETGISFIKLTEAMDAGPIYRQVPVSINNEENIAELSSRLAEKGARELSKVVTEVLKGTAKAVPQDDSQATYCQLIEKTAGIVDWNKPAQQIEREIRAYYTWPKSRAQLGSIEVIIRKAHLVPTNTGDNGELDTDYENFLMINTEDGRICIDIIQPLGKKEMPVQAFLAGYKNKLKP